MTSTDERREVAARLRERERGWRKMGTHLMVMPDKPANQFEDIASLLGFEGSVLDADVFGKLANLVDPTCCIQLWQSDSDLTDEPHFVCSRCGKDIDVFERRDYRTLDGIVRHADYCKFCGARVVSSDD